MQQMLIPLLAAGSIAAGGVSLLNVAGQPTSSRGKAATTASCCVEGVVCASTPPSKYNLMLASTRTPAVGEVTFTRDVAPILQKHCQECHRSQRIGPFPLLTYAEAKRHAADIETVTTDRRMPPWPAEPGFGDVAFSHDRSLSEAEIATLSAWVEGGLLEGDAADLPANPIFNDGWRLGTPDLILELPAAFEVPSEGDDIYRCFVIPTGLTADAQVIGVEYQPENPRIVHHIIGYVDARGEARKRDEAEAGVGYTCFGGPRIDPTGDLGGWAPGATPEFLPDGMGRIVPKGADLVLQVHYHPSGKPETDRSRVGLYLAKPDDPVKQAFHWWAAGAEGFTIPAGESDFPLRGEWPMPVDVQLVALSPHMHLIGREMSMTARKPDGTKINLIRIPAWDFNWQLQYILAEPIDLPKDSVIEVEARYDNSAANPNQPEGGPRDVHFGEATTDEMCYGFFGVVKKGQDLSKPGERDDLLEILAKQARDLAEKHKDESKAADGGD